LEQKAKHSKKSPAKPARKAATQRTAAARTIKKVLTSEKAALPIGPYSQAIQTGNFIFVAGEKGIDRETGKVVPGGIGPETRQTLENVKAILAEAGATLDHAVACTVHMTDLNEFGEMNKVYAEYFKVMPPGRTTVQVQALPAGVKIEITVTAVLQRT
jgi:2-iminobutanoate/2-iminopropanoate deaminase